MRNLLRFLFIIWLWLNTYNCYAQKYIGVSFEEAKNKCKGIPYDKRIRVRVARFNVTAGKTNSELGQNMATILTNALQEINCFRVLTSLDNSDDLKKEIAFGNSEHANHKTAAKKGKMLGAQMIVTGEITEFNTKKTFIGVNKVRLGFIVSIVDAETGDVYFSKSVNVVGEPDSTSKTGWLSSGFASSPALANALEQGVVQSAEFIAQKIDELPFYKDMGLVLDKKDETAANEPPAIPALIFVVTINKIEYADLDSFAAIMKSNTNIKKIQKNFSRKTGTLNIEYTGTPEEIIDDINKRRGAKYQVETLGKGMMTLKPAK